MQAFDRGLPLPEERLELLFDLGGPTEEVGVAELRRRRPGLQLQRRQQGPHLVACGRAAAARPSPR